MSLLKPAAELSASLLVAKGAAAPMAYAAGRPLRSMTLVPPPADRPRTPSAVPPGPRAGRAKLSLRLEPDLHLRLKVVAAHLQMSRQDVLIAALEAFLESTGPELANGCLCARPWRREPQPTSGS